MNKIRLLAENLIVLSDEVGANLKAKNESTDSASDLKRIDKGNKKKKKKSAVREYLCGTNGTRIRRRHLEER